MNYWTKIWIWAVIIGGVFAYLWWQGQIRRFADYCRATWEELKKCSWPTRNELRGSTTLIIVTILLLGGFTVAVDQVLFLIFVKLF